MRRIARFSVNHIKSIMIGYTLLVMFFGGVLAYRLITDPSVIDNSVAIWFMQDDPELKVYDDYNKDFGEQEWTILLLKTNSIYDPEFLMDLSDITGRIAALNHIKKVNSITNIRDNKITGDDMLSYDRIYPGNEALTKESLEEFKQRLSGNPIFDLSLIRIGDETSTVVLIQNDNLIRKLEPYRIEMIDSIRLIVASYPTIQNYALAGTTVINAELNRSSKRDVGVFYTLLSVMLILFGYISLRSWKNILIMLMVVVGSIVPTMGLIALLHIPFNMITVMMPTVLIALSVADVVHIIGHFHYLRLTRDPKDAMEDTIRKLHKPAFWTSLTTAVGFTSLIFSTVYPIAQLGLFTSVGVILALLLSLILAPGLLVKMFPGRSIRVRKDQQGHSSMEKLPALIFKYKYLTYGILLLLCISLTGISLLKVDTNYTRFFGKKTIVSRAYHDIRAGGFAQNPVTIVFQYPQGFDYTSSPYFSQILRFEKEASELPEVIKILSVNDLLYQVDKAFLKEESSFSNYSNYRDDQVAQLLLLAEMSNNDDVYDLLKFDRSAMQVQVLTNYMSSKELDAFKAKLTGIKSDYISGEIDMTITGSTVLWANMDKQISRTQLYSLFGVLTFLVVFFPVIFKSLKLGLLAVVVNLLPILITYGFMGFSHVEINMATAIIGGISLGIISDDTIHLVHRFRHNLMSGLTPIEAVSGAIITSGRSVIMTSLILVGSFSVMTTSNFLPTYNFGLLVSICVIVALFMDMAILPNLLSLYRRRIHHSSIHLSTSGKALILDE